MKWRISLFGAATLLFGLCSSGFGLQKANPADPRLVPFCSLVADPRAYEGKEVKVRASYRYGFEWQEIFCQPCRNVGKTWLELNEDREPYYKAALKKFPKHQGTVNAVFTGTFHSSKGAYGDGGYRFQFIVTAISDPEVVSREGSDPAYLPANSRRKVCGVTSAARHLLPVRGKSTRGESTAVGQDAGANTTRKIVRKNGWTVPGRDDMSTLVRVETTEIEGVKVDKRILRSYSDRDPLATVDFFTTDPQGNLNINSSLFSVRNMIEYEAKGNIFGYQVGLIPTDANRDGTRTTLGVAYTFFYLDQDGDGNFETRIDGGQRLSVPPWVKSGSSKASSKSAGQ